MEARDMGTLTKVDQNSVLRALWVFPCHVTWDQGTRLTKVDRFCVPLWVFPCHVLLITISIFSSINTEIQIW